VTVPPRRVVRRVSSCAFSQIMGTLAYRSPSEMAALRLQAQGRYQSVDRQQGRYSRLGTRGPLLQLMFRLQQEHQL
jgi:hypothetical protein